MRVGIISDSHGSLSLLEKVIKKMGEVDAYIHLGDYITDADTVLKKTEKKYIVVKGNCDIQEGEEEVVIQLAGKKLLITHGHQYNIKSGYNNIYYRTREEKADIVLFGHTHMPVSLWYKGRLFFNPGSIAFPRGGSLASYGVIDIVDGEIYPYIYKV